MTIENAFHCGLKMVQEAGIPAKAGDVAVIAALTVFSRRARGLQRDPRFAAEAPQFARRVILEAYATGK